MKQRKILIVTNRVPYPLKDGGNLAMHAMIEGYKAEGWKVHLLSMNTTRHRVQTGTLQKLFQDLYAFDWIDVNNNLKWTDIVKNYLFSSEPEHVGRFFTEEFKKRIKDILISFKPDVVQIESVYLSTYLAVIKEYSNAVTVLRLHNIEYQIWQGLAKKQKNRLKQIYFNSLTERIRNFERAAWKEYDLLLPITEKDAYMVERLEEVKNIIIAPFSIDIEKIKPGINERWVGYHIGDSFLDTWIDEGFMQHANTDWQVWSHFSLILNRDNSAEKPRRYIADYDWVHAIKNADCIILMYTSFNLNDLGDGFIEKAYDYFYPKNKV